MCGIVAIYSAVGDGINGFAYPWVYEFSNESKLRVNFKRSFRLPDLTESSSLNLFFTSLERNLAFYYE